ncbi:MAG: hypothetical protein QOH12_186 [Solirubrobacteraceae bacterium]|jgi:transposase|nr:hypothetical protein [Solirubrobacteraceae bacterium]
MWRVDARLRHIDCLDERVDRVEAVIGREALESRDAQRLMTPQVSIITAVTFTAPIDDINGFGSALQLGGYLVSAFNCELPLIDRWGLRSRLIR